jgi:hypothetical protein
MADSTADAIPSWRDAYVTGANALTQAGVNGNSSNALSNTAFRNILSKSAVPIGSSVAIPKGNALPAYVDPSGSSPTSNLDARIKAGGIDGFAASAQKVAQTPVIKSILDALSVGTYSTANIANDALSGIDKVAKGDGSGLLDVVASPVTGIGKGLSAAGGNSNDAKTWSDVIKHAQDSSGVDSNNDAAKWAQGVGGFVGDVALDPLTYATFGTGALAKGAIAGFREGGMAATKAAKAAVEAGTTVDEAGNAVKGLSGAVDPKLEAIANQSNPGVVNKFVQAYGQGKDAYKDWMKNEAGGKPVKFELPFSNLKNPKDAPAIQEQNLNAGPNNALADLANTPAPAMAVPVKTPQVAAEENAITDGLSKAAEPTPDAPAISNTPVVKAEDTPRNELNNNMQDILNTTNFTKPTYSPDTLAKFSDAHAASLPSVGTVPGKIDTSALVNDIKTNATKDDTSLLNYGGKQVHPRIVARDFDKAADTKGKVGVLQKLDPQYVERFRSQGTADIPGAPIDFSDPALSKIAPEHQGMTPEELVSHRSPTSSTRDMQSYILKDATPDEISNMSSKLGLPETATRSDISNEFGKQFKDYSQSLTDKLKETVKPNDIVGTANQQTANIVDKVPVEQTLIRRATRAIETNQHMTTPLGGVKYPEHLKIDDISKLPERTTNAALEYQAGKVNGMDKHKLPSGALSNTPEANTGNAVFTGKWGTQSAVAMHGSLVKDISDIANNYQKASGERLSAAAKMQLYKRAMDSSMANLRAMGVAPYLDLGRKIDSKMGVNLGMDDISSILFKDAETRFFAGPAKGMQPQALMTGVEQLMRGKAEGLSEKEIADKIYNAFTGDRSVYRGAGKDINGKPDRGVSQDIVDSITGVGKADSGVARSHGMEAYIRAGMKGNTTYAEAKASYLKGLRTMADKWAGDGKLYQNLSNRMIVNAKEHAAELGAVVDHVSKDVEAKIVEKAASGISIGDFLNEMKQVISDGKAALGPEDADKYALWETEMNALRAKVMTKGEQQTVRTAESTAKLDKPEDIAKSNMKTVDDNTADAQSSIAEDMTATGQPAEFYDVVNSAISMDAWRKIHPIMTFFSPKFGLDASGMQRAIGTGLHTQVRMQSVFHSGLLTYLAKNPEKLMEDWKVIQNEALLHVGSKADFLPSTQSAKDLYNVVNSIFDVSKDNLITRNGIAAKHWNDVAQAKGLKDFELDPEKSTLENSRLWMTHEGLKDSQSILDFMSRAHAVSTNVTNDISIASNFARKFGSNVPKDGYVKISNWTGRGKSRNEAIREAERKSGFYDVLPKSLYYSKEAATNIAQIHRVMNESRSLSQTTATGKFMANVFNPITNLMKASQTIVRPGHWVNNTLGDVFRNYIAGVNSITPYRHTFGIMKAGGKEMKAFGDNPLEAYQWHKATTDGDFKIHGRGDGVVINLDGKPQKVSYDSMFRLMQDGPIMQHHHGGGVAEDFMNADPGTLNKFGSALEGFQNKVLDNPAFSLNSLAAQRDNLTRISLAVDTAMKGKFKDIHELKAAMEDKVLQWIPTSSDFTAKEAKYVRPAFMYYTWLRGVTPRIIDTMMNKPGVAIGPSKALYELAKQNGIDPVSIGNPFPPNAAMPSYYYNNVIGPLMKGEGASMWGMNFANPVTDVMDQLGAGVTPQGLANGKSEVSMGQTLLSAVSPFAKMPIELATQQSNGVPIKDNAQYLQDSLTGSYGGLLSKMTGKLITGQGRTDTANGAAHGVPQDDVAALQIANFLSGLKIQDYQSPAALRSYKGEQKANVSTAKADIRRNL